MPMTMHPTGLGAGIDKDRRDYAVYCGLTVYQHACALGCEGIVSKRLGSHYRWGRSPDWLKFKNPQAPAIRREAEEDWGRGGWRR